MILLQIIVDITVKEGASKYRKAGDQIELASTNVLGFIILRPFICGPNVAFPFNHAKREFYFLSNENVPSPLLWTTEMGRQIAIPSVLFPF